jgi:hypothetical protein
MNIDFSQLSNIKGVTDAFLYSKGGEVLAPQLSYTASRILQLGKEVAFCSFYLEKLEQEVDFMEFIYEDQRVIVRLSQNFFILVICESATDSALIKLTLNVIHEGVKGDKDIQKLLSKLPGKKDFVADAQEEAELRELLATMKITV